MALLVNRNPLRSWKFLAEECSVMAEIWGEAPNTHNYDVAILIYEGLCQNAPDHIHYSLRNAAVDGDSFSTKPLLQFGEDINEEGNTALHLALKVGCEKVPEVLLLHKVDVYNQDDNDGWTALHFAVFWGYEEVVDMLQQRKADMDKQDNYGTTALHEAARLEMRKRLRCCCSVRQTCAKKMCI